MAADVRTSFFSFFGTQLPEKRPADLAIEFSRDGGMNPVGDKMKLSSKGGTYKSHYTSHEASIEFSVTEKDLDDLYRVFRDNRFDHIRISDAMEDDKEGEFIRISWGTTNYHLETSGTEIANRWKKNWKNIVDALNAIVLRETDKRKMDLKVMVDKQLAGRYVTVNISENAGNLAQIVPADGLMTILKLLPGNYYFNIQAIKNYDPKKYQPWEEVRKNLIDIRKSIDISKIKGVKIGMSDETNLSFDVIP